MDEFNLPTMFQLCLMHARADRAMRSVVSEQLAKQNLSLMEWLTLNVVAKGPKEGVSMSHIAKTLDVTLPQVSALINTLIKIGAVKQKVLASDRRGRQVIATTRGKHNLQKLENDVAKAMRSWSQGIPREQLQNYIFTVSQLADKIDT